MKKTAIFLLAMVVLLAMFMVLPAAARGTQHGGNFNNHNYNHNYGNDFNNNNNDCGNSNNNDWNWGGNQGGCNPPQPPTHHDGGCDYHPPCDNHPGCPGVPEPSSLALLGGGLASFVSWVGIRRRNKLS
jgi:hypothetical protein